jgi:hypothetical protein
VYLGESANYVDDVSWVEEGFLPFGNESKAEKPEFSFDKREDDEEDINESWEVEIKYWKITEAMKKCIELINPKVVKY